ncbi:type II secretion system protein [Shewanella sp. CG12_big_fil_rev_8_21_14_0_65_47_15]|uniref:type II secretion system protein n=1 Tax=Shewanella sp. CG12_big_fil_rev_8_21_14_0_65_47_15 TaxID=1975537 RepID=UPI000CC635FA|nr:type II secretion system protein [Shewanella sp. CG12_big_fil_rev_8_21_14_0_65_47_15]PIW59982.1 MAG: MSHA biogenesis protein MshA [Shewanella sp. CG12_big_fil_rev_8_21_14_0_65_47_15]
MKRQQGFTLIELVVVIIILGILAVTAAPKFINLQKDARASALQGVKGAIQGANSLVYSKAALAGKEKGSQPSVSLGDTGTIAILDGYMLATKASLEAGMDITFDVKADPQLSTADWIIDPTAGTPGTAKIYAHGAPDNCFLTYTEAKAANTSATPVTPAELPKYVITDSGC